MAEILEKITDKRILRHRTEAQRKAGTCDGKVEIWVDETPKKIIVEIVMPLIEKMVDSGLATFSREGNTFRNMLVVYCPLKNTAKVKSVLQTAIRMTEEKKCTDE